MATKAKKVAPLTPAEKILGRLLAELMELPHAEDHLKLDLFNIGQVLSGESPLHFEHFGNMTVDPDFRAATDIVSVALADASGISKDRQNEIIKWGIAQAIGRTLAGSGYKVVEA